MARYMRTDLGRGHTNLGPPAVVGAGIYYRGILTSLAAVRRIGTQPRRFARYELRPPTVVLAPPIFFGPRTTLVADTVPQADGLTRRAPSSKLAPPAVVGAGVYFRGVLSSLTAVRRGVQQPRRFARYRLEPPAVVTEVFIAPPVHVTLVTQTNQPVLQRTARRTIWGLRAPIVREPDRFFGPVVHLAYSRRGTPKPRLQPPAVITAVVFTAEPVRVTTAAIKPPSAHYRVSPPTVVFLAVELSGPKVTLTRITPPPTAARLQPPVVVFLAVELSGPEVQLARIKPPPVRPRLEPPVVVFLAVELSGPEIVLAPSRRGIPRPRLQPPAVVGAGIVFRAVQAHLAYSRRGAPRSKLQPPAVVTAAEVYYGPSTTLAPQRRGQPKPVLNPPAHVQVEPNRPLQVHLTYQSRRPGQTSLQPPTVIGRDVFFGPAVTLVPQARGKPEPRLFPPAVVGAGIVYRAVLTHLTYSLRGKPKSRLQPPAVVASPTLFFGPRVTLTRIRPRPTTTTLGVFPPQAVVYAPVAVHLTYSRRGKPSSSLTGLPIGASDVYTGPRTHLAYSLRGKPKSRLFPTKPGVEPFRPVQITLATNKPQPTTAVLEPPAVVQPLTVVFYGPQTNLTYSRRGEPLSALRPPAVVGAGIVFRPVLVSLVPSPQPQRAPHSRLFAPVVVRLAVELSGPEVTLAPSRYPRPISSLGPPTVVAAAAVFFGPQISLAPSSHGNPVYRLSPPTVVLAAAVYYGPNVWLTYSRRGEPIWRLSPPTVVFPPPELLGPDVTLAPQSRGKPIRRLSPPAVVRTAVEIYGPRLTLAPSRFPKPKSRLRPPPFFLAPFRPLLVHLTYSRRGKPIFELRPPAVVRQPPFRPIQLHLTRITPPPTISVLRPPAVVGAGIVFAPVTVWLAPSFRGVPKSKIKPPTVTEFFRDQGDVCGFDVAASFVCGQDTTADNSRVTGTDRNVGGVTGGDQKAT